MVLRVEAYLRIACSVLGFEIGELWCARNIPGQAPSLRFIQLFTSPTYEEFHRTLVQPDGSSAGPTANHSRHRFSPIVCRGVCDGGQIVWANTRISNGFIGCTDLPLNTAVGLPVCSIGEDLCIIVLYSVPVMPISPNAVEFLCSITRAASEGEGGFLPNITATPISPPMTEQFVGVWDMAVFVSKYAKDVDFQLLPLNQLQGYIDFQERVAFKELFEDFKQKRDGRFTEKQISSLRKERLSMEEIASRTNSDILHTNSEDKEDITGPGAFMIDLDPLSDTYLSGNESGAEEGVPTDSLLHRSRRVSDWYSSLRYTEEKSGTGIGTGLGDAISSISIDMLDHPPRKGSWGEPKGGNGLGNGTGTTTTMATLGGNGGGSVSGSGSSSSAVGGTGGSSVSVSSSSMAPVDARLSYAKHRERFHEFMVAVLGMTIFDAAELWLLNERTNELHVVAALHRNGDMQVWTMKSKDIRLGKGRDVPGQVLLSDYPIWDHNYNNHISELGNYPRAMTASDIGVKTAFGVPLAGPSGAVGVLMLYSKKEVDTEPLVVTLVLKAAQLLSACSLSMDHIAKLDIENIIHAPKDSIDLNISNPSPLSSPKVKPSMPNISMSTTNNMPSAFNANSDTSYATAQYLAPMVPIETSSQLSEIQNTNKDIQIHTSIPLADSSKPSSLDTPHSDTNSAHESKESIASDHASYEIPPDEAPKNLTSTAEYENQETSNNSSNNDTINNQEILQRSRGCTLITLEEGRETEDPANKNPYNLREQISSHHKHVMQQHWEQTHMRVPGSMTEYPMPPKLESEEMRYRENIYHNYRDYPGNPPMNDSYTAAMYHAIPGSWTSHLQVSCQRSPLPPNMPPSPNMSMHQPGFWPPPMSIPVSMQMGMQIPMAMDAHHQWYQQQRQWQRHNMNIAAERMRYREDAERGLYGSPAMAFGMSEGDDMGYAFNVGYPPPYPLPPAPKQYPGASALMNHRRVPLQATAMEAPSSPQAQKDSTSRSNDDSNRDYCREINDGGNKVCKLEGCTAPASKRSPYCANHIGTRRCQFDGCSKCAQGNTKYCIAHGGGRRCTYPGCSKGARDKFFCAAHGGGKRCRVNDCTKSAVGGSRLCTAHGGGKRCQASGCSKSAQSSTLFCVRHGGGRKCRVSGCNKVSRGKTEYCAAHGGGIKCRAENCMKAAAGKYFYCKEHLRLMNATVENLDDMEEDEVFSGVTPDSQLQSNSAPNGSTEDADGIPPTNGGNRKRALPDGDDDEDNDDDNENGDDEDLGVEDADS